MTGPSYSTSYIDGHVHAGDRRELAQHGLARRRGRRASTRRRRRRSRRSTSSPSPITNASTYSASGSGLYAQWPPAITIGSAGARSSLRTGHAREVDQVQQVRVDELGREVERQHVEVGGGAVRVDAEQRQARGAHRRLHVGPRRVGALGHRIGPLVQDFVKDLEPLVGEADLVGVGIDQEEGNPAAPRGAAECCLAPCRCSERASPPGPGAVRSAATGQTSSEQHSWRRWTAASRPASGPAPTRRCEWVQSCPA